MSKIGIIGSGNVGANTAFFIAETGVTDVLLYDIREGYSSGISLDIMEAAPIREYRNRIRGIDSLDELEDAETVIIAAGAVREQGMKREDLLEKNREIITGLAEDLAESAPEAVIIVATEPVDICTGLFLKSGKHPKERVMGLGGILDTTRFRYLVAERLSVSLENVSAMVIGRHSEEMIVLPEYTRVSGVPITQLLDDGAIREMVEETKKAGDLIVELSKRGSAYYAPSSAAAALVESIHMDLKRTFSVSLMLTGEYGIDGAALSLPAVIGRSGIEKILTPELKENSLERLKSSADKVRKALEGGNK